MYFWTTFPLSEQAVVTDSQRLIPLTHLSPGKFLCCLLCCVCLFFIPFVCYFPQFLLSLCLWSLCLPLCRLSNADKNPFFIFYASYWLLLFKISSLPWNGKSLYIKKTKSFNTLTYITHFAFQLLKCIY